MSNIAFFSISVYCQTKGVKKKLGFKFLSIILRNVLLLMNDVHRYMFLLNFGYLAINRFPADRDKGLLQNKSVNPACTEKPASDFYFNAVQVVKYFECPREKP